MTDPTTSARIRAAGSDGPAPPVATPGVRVVLDARPLQEPDRAPLTAAYLDGLLGAFDADPLDGESFAFLLRSDLDDPTAALRSHLDVVGRRLLPPTRLLRSGAMTIDPFLLRGASVGAAWRAERGGAAGRRLPHGRERAAADRVGAAGRRHAARPRAVGAARGLRAIGRRAGSASGCGRSSCARRAAVIVGTPAVAARRPPAPPHPRRPDARRPARAARPAFATGAGPARRRPPSTSSAALPASASGSPSAISSTPGGTTPGTTSRRCCGRSPRLPAETGPPDLADEVPWPPRVLVRRGQPGRPRLDRPRRGAGRRRRRC